MKKILILFAMLFAFSVVTVYAADPIVSAGKVLVNATDSVYHDGKTMVDSVYHDGKEIVKTVYGDAKEGAVSIYPDVRKAVVAIGKAIGIAAEHVYSVLVKKYFVLGIKQAVICLIGFIAFIIGLVMWKKATPQGQPITYRIIAPIFLIVVGLVTICNVNYDEMLMGIINPEYGAINYILEYSKNLFNGN